MNIQTKITLSREDIKKIVSDHLKRNGQKLLTYSLDGNCSNSWCTPAVTVTVEPSEKLQHLKDVSDADET